jgi:pyrroloquinoline quinone biosynthesis protein E
MSWCTAPTSSASPTWSRWRLSSARAASKSPMCNITAGRCATARIDANAAQVARAAAVGRGTPRKHHGEIVIDAVVPDYHARLPKPCVGGWGRTLAQRDAGGQGAAVPCGRDHPGLEFWSVREHSLADIWKNSPAFNAFRGTAWMREPCQSCARRDIDFGGCRCQAFALTGDARATDPVCHLAPGHDSVAILAAAREDAPYAYRHM